MDPAQETGRRADRLIQLAAQALRGAPLQPLAALGHVACSGGRRSPSHRRTRLWQHQAALAPRIIVHCRTEGRIWGGRRGAAVGAACTGGDGTWVPGGLRGGTSGGAHPGLECAPWGLSSGGPACAGRPRPDPPARMEHVRRKQAEAARSAGRAQGVGAAAPRELRAAAAVRQTLCSV